MFESDDPHHWQPRAILPARLVRPVRPDPTGADGPTPREAAGRYWRRTSRGWYVPIDVPDELPEQRILEASVRLPMGGAVTGWAGCRLHGANFFDGLARDGQTRIPVELALGAGGWLRPEPGSLISAAAFDPAEVTSRYGIPVLGIERCVADAVHRSDSLTEAVVCVDMALAAQITTLPTLLQYADSHRVPKLLRRALPLASEFSLSPLETRARLQLAVDCGLTRLLVNATVLNSAGRSVGTADLLDEEAGLVIELDGRDHLGAGRHRRDLAKDEALRSLGLEVTRLSGADVRDRRLTASRVLTARSRARFEDPDTRQWRVAARA